MAALWRSRCNAAPLPCFIRCAVAICTVFRDPHLPSCSALLSKSSDAGLFTLAGGALRRVCFTPSSVAIALCRLRGADFLPGEGGDERCAPERQEGRGTATHRLPGRGEDPLIFARGGAQGARGGVPRDGRAPADGAPQSKSGFMRKPPYALSPEMGVFAPPSLFFKNV